MQEIDVAYDSKCDPIALVENSCAAVKLVLGSKGTLKTYPGSTHWHYKNPPNTGTLEITYWPKSNRLWLKIQNRRRAQWISDCLPLLIEKLQN